MAKLETYIQDLNGFKLVTKLADYLSHMTGSDKDESRALKLLRRGLRGRHAVSPILRDSPTSQ